MKPGRALDVLVHERVMGLAVYRDTVRIHGTNEVISYWDGPIENNDASIVPYYSDAIASAWTVADAIHAMISNQRIDGKRTDLNFLELAVLGRHAGVAVSFNPNNRRNWWEYADSIPFSARGETAAHAICLAALKVVNKKTVR